MTTTTSPAKVSLVRRALRAAGSVMLVAMVAVGVLPTATAQAAGVTTQTTRPIGASTTAMSDPTSTRLTGSTAHRYRVTGTGLTRL